MFLVTAFLSCLCIPAIGPGIHPSVAPHDPGLSSVRITRRAEGVVVHAAFANADFKTAAALDENGDGAIDAAELARGSTAVGELVHTGFVLRTAGGLGVAETLRATEISAQLAENHDVELTMHFRSVPGDVTLVVELLSRLSRGHRSYVAALAGEVESDDAIVADALLSPLAREFPLPAATVVVAGFSQATHFFVLGIEHILIGFDHLAFLLALLVVGITLRRAVATITAFTVAHSLTLVAASLGVVRLPGVLVESTIAASIVWVAVANICRRRKSAAHRWPLAFGFGLVHGFGFASVLADLHIGGPGMLAPLVTFNLGVEVGQLAFAAVVLPLLWLAARQPRLRHVPLLLSIAVGAAGAFWFVQRTIGW